MTNLFNSAIASIKSLLNNLQVKQFLSVVMVGFVVLTTNVSNVDAPRNNKTLPESISKTAHQIDSTRPKTTKEWYGEAEQTKGAPGERLKNIAEESGKAVQEFGGMYPDVAKDSTGIDSSNNVVTGKNRANHDGINR